MGGQKRSPLFMITVVSGIVCALAATATMGQQYYFQWSHEGIFRDIVRQNRRRLANGFPPMTDDEIAPDLRDEFRRWKDKNGITE